jgi:hypothetical protein
VLDLLPAVRVPAILRCVVAEGSYSYYVSVLDEACSVAVATTINGAPISLTGSGSGEVRTTLTLPSQRRSRVTIGFRTDGSVFPDGSPPVEHDPAHPVLPLVFVVRPVFARLVGRVAGFAADELPYVGVAFQRDWEEQAQVVQPEDDGRFELARVPFGKGTLYLVRSDERGASTEVLARLELELTGDRDGLVLTPDPASLPEQPPSR